MSHNHLVERIAVQLAPLVPARSSILVGLSGGVDSVVLLHLLRELAPRFSWQLSALHVHHGLSPNADTWAAFCTGLCAGYAIPLRVEQVDIAPLREHGIEAAARRLRHAALARQPADFVALAHHADDQAETLLLQLLRGAGVKGAAAMPVLSSIEGPFIPSPLAATNDLTSNSIRERAMHPPHLLRPLLHFSRREILDHAATHGLRWIEDESNADERYPRNFLRHRVLPLLEQKFPACRTTLARGAQHFAEASELLDDLAQLDAHLPLPAPAGAHLGERVFEIVRLQSLSGPRARNLLRWFLHSMGAPMPQAVQLDDMLRQLCDAREDAVPCVVYGDYEVRRYRGKVHVLRTLGEFDQNLILPWHGEAGLDWPALDARLEFTPASGQGMSLARLQRAPVTLRLRRGGEALRPHPGAATRTLKNLLQEHGVPPWQRDRLPLLYCGDELVCIAGVAVAAAYQAGSGEAALVMNLRAARPAGQQGGLDSPASGAATPQR